MRRRSLGLVVAAWVLAGCPASRPPTARPPDDEPTKGFGNVRDSVYVPVDRSTPPPAGYGLYTALLSRSADGNTTRVLAELLRTTVSASDGALPRENLNLIVLPVRSAAEARVQLANARTQPEAVAGEVLKGYDFGQAAKLLAIACQSNRTGEVARACGNAAVASGPVLVTTLRPLDAPGGPGERMLVVNLSNIQPRALREVFASYRQQVQRRDFERLPRSEEWRLTALNSILEAAELLPPMAKAYASIK